MNPQVYSLHGGEPIDIFEQTLNVAVHFGCCLTMHEVLSLFISTKGNGDFHIGRALSGNIAYYSMSTHLH